MRANRSGLPNWLKPAASPRRIKALRGTMPDLLLQKVIAKPLRSLAVLAVVVAIVAPVSSASAFAGVSVSERVKYYTISGKTAPDFARAMSRRGPFDASKGRRAWATAARKMSYRLTRSPSGNGCRVTDADVAMTITLTLPKLRSPGRSNRSEVRKWKSMIDLLERHERVHVRYYRELAANTQRALLRLRPEKTCRELERKALKLVRDLSDKDTKRNQSFDQRDGRNYRRMTRIYSGS